MTISSSSKTTVPIAISETISALSQTISNVSSTSTKTWTTLAVGAAAVLVTGTAVKNILRMSYWRRALRIAKTGEPAPGPTPIPFLGNVLDLRVAYYETLHRYVNEPASVFWVHATPFFVVNDEESLRRVLGGSKGLYSKPKYFGYRSKAVSSAVEKEKDIVAKESIQYDVNGDASRVALDNMIKSSLPKIKQSMANLLNVMTNESSIDQKDSVHTIRKAIVSLNLDVLFGSIDTENADRISDMIDFAGTEFGRRMVNPMKVFFDISGNIRFLRDVTALISLGRRLGQSLDAAAAAFAESESEKSEVTSAAGVSWVHAWVGKVGRVGKLGKLVGLLMASTQTVPLTATWLLYLVSQHDDVRLKLIEELRKNGINDVSKDLTHEKLTDPTKLVYLEAVVRETLRLYPPFPLIQRQVQDDDVLAGITVPKGMIVYVVPWLVHRNESFWKDAHEFKPERFIATQENDTGPTVAPHGDAKSDWLYLPFGRGPRMCAGSKLALTELKVLVVHAVLGCEWSSERTKNIRDERFPELGMVPKGIKINVNSNQVDGFAS